MFKALIGVLLGLSTASANEMLNIRTYLMVDICDAKEVCSLKRVENKGPIELLPTKKADTFVGVSKNHIDINGLQFKSAFQIVKTRLGYSVAAYLKTGGTDSINTEDQVAGYHVRSPSEIMPVYYYGKTIVKDGISYRAGLYNSSLGEK